MTGDSQHLFHQEMTCTVLRCTCIYHYMSLPTIFRVYLSIIAQYPVSLYAFLRAPYSRNLAHISVWQSTEVSPHLVRWLNICVLSPFGSYSPISDTAPFHSFWLDPHFSIPLWTLLRRTSAIYPNLSSDFIGFSRFYSLALYICHLIFLFLRDHRFMVS